jgi:hypothetical protein
VDPGVLTLLLAGWAVAAPVATDSVVPASARAQGHALPGREGSASGALREAMHGGAFDVPWILSAELDGQAEAWLPWAGLPLRETVVPAQGGEDLLAGAGGAGPLSIGAVAARTRPGWGGLDERLLLPHPSATDTPRTHIHFWRGAVNSYRFGFGLSRAVVGPWSLDLRMNTRSAPGRFWEYRQQVNDMFGPRGKPQGLPYQGKGPGQDDVRWEAVVRRDLAGGILDLGWNWVEVDRGVPHPLSTWDSLLPKSEAYTARSGFFGRLNLERQDWSLQASAREETQDWALPAWTDTGSRGTASGSETRRFGDLRLGLGPTSIRGFLEARYENQDGSASVPRAVGEFDSPFQDDRLRVGTSGQALLGGFRLEAGAGWNRLERAAEKVSPDVRGMQGFDGRAALRWESDVLHGLVGWNRSVVLPGFDQTERPDPLLPRLESRDLIPEARDVLQMRGSLATGAFGAELGAALLQVSDPLRPAILPGEGNDFEPERHEVLRLDNRAESVLGWALEAGVHGAWRWFDGSVRIGYGHTGLPGEPLGGRRDPTEAAMRSRSSLRWSAELLPGRFRATSTVALSTWSETRHYVPIGISDAGLMELPGDWNLDLENRCEIRTFELFWRIENLGHRRQMVLPGWTPLGIRSGWGVVWNFGG